MSTQVQRRKGTTAQHATFTGASAELTVDTTKNTVVVHDGATAGGIPLAKETGSAISATSLTSSGASVINVSSTSPALRITQSSSGDSLIVEDSTNPDSTPFIIDNNGKVIAGYTSIVAPDLNNSSIFPQMNVVGTSSNAQYAAFSYINAAANAPIVSLSKSRGAAIGTNTIVASGDTIGIIKFTAADGTAFVPAASITAQVDGTPGTNDMPGRLVFSTTADGASSPTERMRIASNGDISIAGGTANGVTYLNGSKVLTSGTALTFDGISLTLPSFLLVASSQSYFGDNGVIGGGAADGNTTIRYFGGKYLAFKEGSSEQMRLTSTGLGIGTSSPAHKLDVYGTGSQTVAVRAATSGDARFYTECAGTNSGWMQYTRSLQALQWSANGSTQHLTLDSSGNLGIGTSSPGAKLQVGSGSITPASFGIAVQHPYNPSINLLSPAATGVSSAMIFGDDASNSLASIKYTNSSKELAFTNQASGGYQLWATGGAERMRLDTSGNLLVGTTSSNGNLAKGVQIASTNWGLAVTTSGAAGGGTCAAFGRGTDGNVVQFYYSTALTGLIGSISVTATATAYNTSSDYRLKNITGPITNSGAYIDSLKPVEGTWKADGSTFVGLIAHETQEASRTTVATGTKDGEQMQGMDYSSAEIIANLIAELQSLRARVASLESK